MLNRLSTFAHKVVNGRRGAFQFLFALVYILMGISYTILPSSPGRTSALEWISEFIPLRILGVIWLIAAAMAIYGAFLPRPDDLRSFQALVIAPTAWGILYLIGAGVTGNWQLSLTTLLYWIIAIAVLVVSGMNGDHDRDNRKIRVRQ